MEPKKRITHEAGNAEAWVCECGNTPSGDGFYPCDEKGNEMEPIALETIIRTDGERR
jgi:hypothetical protein